MGLLQMCAHPRSRNAAHGEIVNPLGEFPFSNNQATRAYTLSPPLFRGRVITTAGDLCALFYSFIPLLSVISWARAACSTVALVVFFRGGHTLPTESRDFVCSVPHEDKASMLEYCMLPQESWEENLRVAPTASAPYTAF